ncbi:MAG: large conductance mechanosensitive channel protein MscL [Candidatus Methanomethylophilaceae archaeon]|nr:large conductance mechanosensitive channel protein MscL [Candidatus Methanomethylophilaceae archaeon]
MGFGSDFKAFISKGNVVDMAVGVVVGSAFGAIITSLVNDIIMPFISLATGGVNVKDLKWVLREAVMDGETVTTPEVAVAYGSFIQYIVNFLIIALCIFCVIRGIQKMKAKMEAKKLAEEEAAKKAAEEEAARKAEEEAKLHPSAEVLLTEIRDLLKAKA